VFVAGWRAARARREPLGLAGSAATRSGAGRRRQDCVDGYTVLLPK